MTDSAQNALAAKRVGQYLIDAAVLTSGQLDEALERQRRMSKAGFHVLLGTILEEMGAIDRQSLEAIILRQRLDEGSVNLGPEVDWTPFRPKAESDSPQNGLSSDSSSLSPERAAEAIDTFFGQAADMDSEKAETAPLTNEPQAEASSPAISHDPEVEMTTLHDEPATDTAPVASFVPIESAAESPVTDASAIGDMHASGNGAPKMHRDEGLPRFPFFGRRSTASSESAEPATESPVESSSAPLSEAGSGSPESMPSWTAPAAATPQLVASAEPATPTVPALPDPTPVPTEHFTPQAAAPVVEPTPVQAAPEPTPAPAPAPQPSAESPVVETGPVEIMGFRFARSSNGVAESEVSAVIGQLIRRTKTLEEQIGEAKETLSHLDSMRRYGEQSIKAADTIAQQIREEAEQHALAIRERAQQEARKIVSDARSQHDEIVRGAGAKAMEISVEVARGIEEHRLLNESMIARARALIETDSSDAEQE
jgi:cell division septum initiation protein DivIVA